MSEKEYMLALVGLVVTELFNISVSNDDAKMSLKVTPSMNTNHFPVNPQSLQNWLVMFDAIGKCSELQGYIFCGSAVVIVMLRRLYMFTMWR